MIEGKREIERYIERAIERDRERERATGTAREGSVVAYVSTIALFLRSCARALAVV